MLVLFLHKSPLISASSYKPLLKNEPQMTQRHIFFSDMEGTPIDQ